MLSTEIGKKLRSRASATSLHVFHTPSNTLHRLCRVFPLPFQIGCKSLIKGGFRVLTAAPGIFFQFGFPLRFNGH